jgi:cyclophilin family peptidyl-prolyl cis-trans isomerase
MCVWFATVHQNNHYDYEANTAVIMIINSLPSTERMVVLARQQDPTSGNTEFSIMLRDNTAINAPHAAQDINSPGFTAFGRVFAGYPTLQTISTELPDGFLAKKNKHQVRVHPPHPHYHHYYPPPPHLHAALTWKNECLFR